MDPFDEDDIYVDDLDPDAAEAGSENLFRQICRNRRKPVEQLEAETDLIPESDHPLFPQVVSHFLNMAQLTEGEMRDWGFKMLNRSFGAYPGHKGEWTQEQREQLFSAAEAYLARHGSGRLAN
jgi:hypothetical protein